MELNFTPMNRRILIEEFKHEDVQEDEDTCNIILPESANKELNENKLYTVIDIAEPLTLNLGAGDIIVVEENMVEEHIVIHEENKIVFLTILENYVKGEITI